MPHSCVINRPKLEYAESQEAGAGLLTMAANSAATASSASTGQERRTIVRLPGRLNFPLILDSPPPLIPSRKNVKPDKKRKEALAAARIFRLCANLPAQ